MTGLIEDDFQLVSKQYNSKFITYKITPGAQTFKHLSEVLSRGFKKEFEIGGGIQPNNKYEKSDSIIMKCDNNTMKTNLIVGHGINAMRFDKKSLFSLVLGFSPYWFQKVLVEYFSEEVKNSTTLDRIHLKFDCIDGYVVRGLRKRLLFGFVLDKPPG